MKTPFSDEQRAAIAEHLATLRSTKEFAEGSRKYRILEYLVTAETEGNGDRLKAYAIGVDVLDRRADFDPSEDSIVRVEMARLRTALSIFYHTHQTGLRIEIPKGTYRPEFNEICTLDESVSKTEEGGRWHRLCLRAYLVCSAVLIVGSFTFLMTHFRSMDTQRIVPDRPVVRVSGEFSTEDMSEVLETLSGFKNIHTILEKYSKDEADYRLVFLMGDNGTTIQGKVIHSLSGQVVSSSVFGPGHHDNEGDFEKWLSSVAQLNGLIEKDYMRRGEFSPVFRCRYLTETYFGNQTDAAHSEARDCLLDQIGKGERSATLFANLALIYREEYSDKRNVMPGDPLFRAMEAARTAIDIDPFDANNHYALMTVLFAMGSVPEAVNAGNIAVKLAPLDGSILGGFASRLVSVGHYADALEMFERSMELNPGQLNWRNYGVFLAQIGVGNRAGAAEISPTLEGANNPLLLAATAIGLNIVGRREEAQARYEQLLEQEPDVREMYERRKYEAGLVTALMAEIQRLEDTRVSH
ncbi:tetratricopeptide repeat protein [Shimia sagamensis]|uniref:Tetratricopeptide repeat protein n=1 Tax=Shimia sagamensis TaxID=1566352 RepID=A0ABY1PL19_9RHOB|nr:hypothetical protein [Shimia sagamensis]SMP35091.1 hypothetical protein SAMN06265373_1113 [Shimia sagamensis]